MEASLCLVLLIKLLSMFAVAIIFHRLLCSYVRFRRRVRSSDPTRVVQCRGFIQFVPAYFIPYFPHFIPWLSAFVRSCSRYPLWFDSLRSDIRCPSFSTFASSHLAGVTSSPGNVGTMTLRRKRSSSSPCNSRYAALHVRKGTETERRGRPADRNTRRQRGSRATRGALFSSRERERECTTGCRRKSKDRRRSTALSSSVTNQGAREL